MVSPFLAQLISVIDRDSNLDLLLDPDVSEPLKALWLHIFENDKLLEVPYTRVDRCVFRVFFHPMPCSASSLEEFVFVLIDSRPFDGDGSLILLCGMHFLRGVVSL